MRIPRVNQFGVTLAAFLLAAGLATSSMAADNKAAATDASASGVPATAHGQPSVFNLTGKIKDPFFPKSTRTNPVPVTNVIAPTFTISSLVLKGISGAEGWRLVLINNKNFAEGESGSVDTPAGKRKITVVKINQFSAVVRAEGSPETVELWLPKDLRE